jgi:hypothetical protein
MRIARQSLSPPSIRFDETGSELELNSICLTSADLAGLPRLTQKCESWSMMRSFSPRFLATAGLAIVGITGIAGAQPAYEPPREFKAEEFAPAALLTGPFHRVDETVSVDGGLPRFIVRSPYGTWEALGLEMLDIRVAELPAFEQMDKVSKSDEFARAAGQAIARPVELVGTFVQHPVDTAGNILTGIGTVVSRAGRTVGSAVTSVGDAVSGGAQEQRSILQPLAPPLGDAPPRAVTSDPLGYNDARRIWAQRLKVDTYTFNGGLSDRLDQLATVTFAGNFAVNLVVSTVAAPLYYAEQTKATALAESYQLPPADIEARNEDRLKKMGISGLPVRTLFRNGYFTPTLQTALVLALEELGEVSGRGEVIAFAARAGSEHEARYVNNSVLLLAQASRRMEVLARVRVADSFVAGETGSGKLVLPLPLDYVAWAKPTEELARRADLQAPERWLLCSGKVTPQAAQELAALGWRVSDKLVSMK